jgi:hypothetical protein
MPMLQAVTQDNFFQLSPCFKGCPKGIGSTAAAL